MSCEITPGEPIDVYLPLTDLVEVSFTASDAAQPSDLQICTVDNEKIQIINPDYKERASRINTLQIKDGNVSDSGSYTVRDVVNNETLAILKVHMREDQPGSDIRQEGGVPACGIVLMLLLLLVVAAFVVLMVMYVRLRRENQQLREKDERNGHELRPMNGNANHDPGEEQD
ncbi:hypothetical protein PHYPO_G00137650 [Pangasianodon hypophthalmus]|uniref:Uncharacterized protein n=1 Tax=Pangasianodon hypophthalmus TaxID=310915 RepID=A0A5N5K9L7_PANHP|nr:hypothetical protein PHYPO_G00137650 [Pangasianodon hypophthalmus]